MLFQSLQDVAETPDRPSPELRLQKELASTHKEKAEALRRVTSLEGKLTELKEHNNHVKFLSPIAGMKPEAKRYPKSPCPKQRLALDGNDDNNNTIGDNLQYSTAAAENIPFEYELDGYTFIIRRPHGLAVEDDLWYKVGQMNANLYSTKATGSNETTMEVACQLPDGSLFCLYDTHYCRHHTIDEGPIDYEGPAETILGSITYVDNSGIDRFYNLDELWGSAIEVRSLYCKTLTAAAAALAAQPVTPIPMVDKVPTAADTVDVGVATEPQPTKQRVEPVVEEDDSPNVFGYVLYPFAWSFRLAWWVLTTFFQFVLLSTFTSVALVLASILYVHVSDESSEIFAIENAYKNHHANIY